MTLPDLVESEDESDSDSEMEQEYNIEEASHHTYDTDDISEEEESDIFPPPGTIRYGDRRKKCVTEISDTDKAEV